MEGQRGALAFPLGRVAGILAAHGGSRTGKKTARSVVFWSCGNVGVEMQCICHVGPPRRRLPLVPSRCRRLAAHSCMTSTLCFRGSCTYTGAALAHFRFSHGGKWLRSASNALVKHGVSRRLIQYALWQYLVNKKHKRLLGMKCLQQHAISLHISVPVYVRACVNQFKTGLKKWLRFKTCKPSHHQRKTCLALFWKDISTVVHES